MTEPEYPTLDEVLQLHDEALQAYGGVPGLKDRNALESALARPRNRLAYTDPGTLDLFDLAATGAAAIAANHAFNDGNKRTAWSSCVLFLKLNGLAVDAPPQEAADRVVALAMHGADETTSAAWLRPRRRPA